MDPGYQRLVRDLDGWSSAVQTAPDRIRVTVPLPGRGSRRVTIVMTPEEWLDMWTVAHGRFEAALHRVKETLLALRPDERFAVYSQYALEGSTTDTLPEPGLPEHGSAT